MQDQKALRKAKKVHQAKKKSYQAAQGATTRARLVSVLAAPEGIAALARAHPEVRVFTAAVDARLNDSSSELLRAVLAEGQGFPPPALPPQHIDKDPGDPAAERAMAALHLSQPCPDVLAVGTREPRVARIVGLSICHSAFAPS